MSRSDAGLALVAAIALIGTVQAADHADSPRAAADPAADITDVFAWMSPDARRVNLIMGIGRDVAPDARFSDAVQYVFRTGSDDVYSVASLPDATTNIICTSDAEQVVTCRVGAITVSGDAGDPAGISDPEGRVRVFAGPRNDPFFFNGSGFRQTARVVTEAAPGLTFDEAGCPALNADTAAALREQLRTEPDGSPAQDDFAGFNILALVLSIDKSLLTRGGPILEVWGSTHLRPSGDDS